MSFRLTYATMFNPPEELHERFEKALATMRGRLGATHPMFIGGKDVPAARTVENASPIDNQLKIGRFPLANAAEVDSALAAAHGAFPGMARRGHGGARAPHAQGRRHPRGARLRDRGGARAGSRQEPAGGARRGAGMRGLLQRLRGRLRVAQGLRVRAAERPVDRLHLAQQERDAALWRLGRDRAVQLSRSRSRPGPTAAALVTGNTVVLKCASDTPWAGRLLADCIRDAGLPAGVFNYVNGAGAAVGEQLVRDSRTAGATFTGSVAVGRAIMAEMAAGRYPRPYIAEMGGKNPTIVTENADLDRAAAGIARSAYGMGGQKCSALSTALRPRESRGRRCSRRSKRKSTRSGSATRRSARRGLGPVVNKRAHECYARYVSELKDRGAKILRGGRQPSEGFARPRLLRRAGSRGGAPRPTRSGSTRCSCRS